MLSDEFYNDWQDGRFRTGAVARELFNLNLTWDARSAEPVKAIVRVEFRVFHIEFKDKSRLAEEIEAVIEKYRLKV